MVSVAVAVGVPARIASRDSTVGVRPAMSSDGSSGGRPRPVKSHKRLTVARRAIKAHTSYPGYHSRLPMVFPYFWTGTVQEVFYLVTALAQENIDRWEEDASTDMLCFASTFHNYTKDTHLTLWLSSGAAQWLTNTQMVTSVFQYERELRTR